MSDSINETFDVVLIDALPLVPVSDPAILSKRPGGAIVVVAAGRTRRVRVAGAIDALDAIGGDVLGVVVTLSRTKGPNACGCGAGHAGYGCVYNCGELDKGADKGSFKKPARGAQNSSRTGEKPDNDVRRKPDIVPSRPSRVKRGPLSHRGAVVSD